MRTRAWLILIVIAVILGAAIRIQGIAFGAPAADARPDENLVIAEAVFILADDQIRYHRYPPALMYLYAGLFKAGAATGYLPEDAYTGYALDPFPYHLLGRWFSAVLGIGTMILVGMTAKRLFSSKAAFVAVFCCATYPLHSLNSHFATVDVPATFFATLTIFLSLTAAREQTGRLVLAAFVAGIAAATKYPVGMVAIIPLVCSITYRAGLKSALLICVATVMGLLVAAPTWMSDPGGVWEGIQTESESQSGRRALLSLGEIIQHHGRFSLMAGFGAMALTLSGLGLISACVRNRAFLGLALFGTLLFAFNFFVGVPFARYFVPLAPVLALGASSLCGSGDSGKGGLIVLVITLFHVPNLIDAQAMSSMLSQKDTRGELLEAFDDGTLPRDLPIIRPSWPFDSFPIADNGALLLVPTEPSKEAGKRQNLMRGLASHLRGDKTRLRVYEFGEKQKSEVDLAQFLGDSDMLYIEPETPDFGDESLTFPFQHKTVGPDVRDSVNKGLVTMTLLLDIDPRKDGSFPTGSLFEHFEYWFVPMAAPGAIKRPGPRIRVYRISARR